MKQDTYTNSEKAFKGFLAYAAVLFLILREAKVLLSICLIAAGCYSVYAWRENVRLQKEVQMYQEIQRYNRLHIPAPTGLHAIRPAPPGVTPQVTPQVTPKVEIR